MQVGTVSDTDFAGDLEDSKSTSGRLLCVHIRTNKLDVQETNFSFTQFNKIWDYFSWCRFTTQDGIPALELWDLVIEVFHSFPNQLKKSKGRVQGNLSRDAPSNKHTHNRTKTPIQHDNLELSNVDFFLTNAKSSQFGAMLYIFEDSEAVKKWSSKAEVQQLETYPEPTDLPLTESIWI